MLRYECAMCMIWVQQVYKIHHTYTGGTMTFIQFRQQHNLTKKAVCKATGLGRFTLYTIEHNLGKAYAHDVLTLVYHYRTIDKSIDTKALLD